MNIFLESENKTVTKTFTGTVKELLKDLKINPVTVIVTKDKTLVTEDTNLKNSDEVDILSVISGG